MLIYLYLLTSHKCYDILVHLSFKVKHMIVKHCQNHHCMVKSISKKLILILLTMMVKVKEMTN